MEYAAVYLGAVLLGLLASLPALVQKQHWRKWKFSLRDLAFSELGVVVVTYCNRGFAISTTPLTPAQASQVPAQAAQIFWADADTGALFIHNWGLPNSYPNWLLPQIFFEKSIGGPTATEASFRTNFTFGIALTNSISITKNSVSAGTGGTYVVWIRRGDGPYE